MPSKRVLVWVAILYVGQGLPFGITSRVLPVYFRTQGVSLAEIGLLSLLALPWSWKPLWAPLVDRFGSRRAWIVPCLLSLALTTALIGRLPAGAVGATLIVLLLAMTFSSATQDLALDAWAVDVATSRTRLGMLNGLRSGAFRTAMIVAGSGALLIAEARGWPTAWLALATLFLLLAAAAFFLPEGERAPKSASAAVDLRANLAWLIRPEMLLVVGFLLLFKLGDQALARMIEPFWVDRGMSLTEIAVAANTFGLALSAAGAIAGGLFVARFGTFRSLLWLGLGQAASNLAYWAVAAFDLPRESIYGAAAIEYFTQGLGSAAALSFQTLLVSRAQAATQYALVSALTAFSRDIAGAFSGFGAEAFGYAGFFALTVLLAVPGLLLLPFLRRRIGALEAPDGDRPAAPGSG